MNEIKRRIVSILRQNPRGLTISKIAKLVGVHRSTIPKHLYELKGENKVTIREVGVARLFYLNGKLTKEIDEKEIILISRSAM